jgi:hypothetical protein
MKQHEVKNKPQTSEDSKTDRKNKQETATAHYAQRPDAQQNTDLYPQGNRYIRSWVEGAPDQRK